VDLKFVIAFCDTAYIEYWVAVKQLEEKWLLESEI